MLTTIDIGLASRSLLLRIGQLAANLARRRAYAKGGRSFWREIGDTIQVHEEEGRVVVGATHVAAGVKHFGGTVSAPGRGPGSLHRRALAIPIGRARANRWDTDEAQEAGYELFRPRGSSILMGRPRAGGSGRGRRRGANAAAQPAGQAEPLFALRKAAQIPADPFWVTDGDLQRVIREAMAMEGWLDG